MKVRADQIKHALSKRHTDDFFLTEVKNGPTHFNNELLIMDAFAMKKSWANPCLTAYEIKVSRNDFQQDQKWPGYLQYCNQFSFVCPTGLIQPDELPEEVGLIYYNPEKSTLYTKRKAKHRLVDIPKELYIYIIMNRLESDRHPFFTTKREYFEALIADREDRKRIGNYVRKQVYDHIRELDKEISDLKRQLQRYKRDEDFKENVKSLLQECGIQTHWGWEERLKERLMTGISTEIKREVELAKLAIEKLQKLVNQ